MQAVRWRSLPLALILCACLALSACSTLQNGLGGLERTADIITGGNEKLINHNQCPDVEISEELSQLYQFTGKSDVKKGIIPDEKTLKSKTKIDLQSDYCSYENKAVTVDIALNFTGELGPHGRLTKTDDPLYSYPFFVAILDNFGKIIAKQIFTANLHYMNEGEETSYHETIRQIIPVDKASDGHKFNIVIGFQLSEEQLAYNRALMKAELVKTINTPDIKTAPNNQDANEQSTNTQGTTNDE